VDAEALGPPLRKLLEDDLRRFAAEGHMQAAGERELRIRLDTHGKIRWFEATSIRVPASELEQSGPLGSA
jgi:hypothetical protein